MHDSISLKERILTCMKISFISSVLSSKNMQTSQIGTLDMYQLKTRVSVIVNVIISVSAIVGASVAINDLLLF